MWLRVILVSGVLECVDLLVLMNSCLKVGWVLLVSLFRFLLVVGILC